MRWLYVSIICTTGMIITSCHRHTERQTTSDISWFMNWQADFWRTFDVSITDTVWPSCYTPTGFNDSVNKSKPHQDNLPMVRQRHIRASTHDSLQSTNDYHNLKNTLERVDSRQQVSFEDIRSQIASTLLTVVFLILIVFGLFLLIRRL